MDGWNTTFLLGRPIFRCYVSFREGNCCHRNKKIYGHPVIYLSISNSPASVAKNNLCCNASRDFMQMAKHEFAFPNSTFKYSMIHQTRDVACTNKHQWARPSCHLPSQSARCGCHPRHRPGLQKSDLTTRLNPGVPGGPTHPKLKLLVTTWIHSNFQQLETLTCNIYQHMQFSNPSKPDFTILTYLMDLSDLSDLPGHLQRSPTSWSLQRWPHR